MSRENLPADELIKFGIMNDDLSFSDKLSQEDIYKFLNGYTIVADHDKNRATFQLVDSNTTLKVILLERDKSIHEILLNSRNHIEYSSVQDFSDADGNMIFQKKAHIYDKENRKVVEFDFVKNARELTPIIADTKDTVELNRYMDELVKYRIFLQKKADQFPNVANELILDLQIVTKELGVISEISKNLNLPDSQRQYRPHLTVTNGDSDAIGQQSEDHEIEEEIEKPRTFRR
ncbi:hypothetical protein ASG01_13800 [Chryseobacterium sp. Leaf180]|jgi:hypothetical protein|uniref:hypothetical protein n=1 Tax=Chryseobacterium sp. Leaf180 TaxID=1736289 RepID=UPI000702189A|nr:hypothetical protein [Chryseobacterium sp. Leaf180]KQR91444.1 hypothetical protein ASG01_13800 [Chryseobacterium sp. Leaf180]